MKSITLKKIMRYVIESMVGDLGLQFEYLKPVVKSIMRNINKVEPSDTEVEEYFRNQILKYVEESLSMNSESDEE